MIDENIKVEVKDLNRVYSGFQKVDTFKMSFTGPSGYEHVDVPREVVNRKSHAVAVLIVDSGNRSLLMRQVLPGAVIAGLEDVAPWQCPAGMIDEGETPAQAAIREVKEETNIEITEDQLHSYGFTMPSPGGCSEIVHLFVARLHTELESDHYYYLSEHENEDVEIKFFEATVLSGLLFQPGKIVSAHTQLLVQNYLMDMSAALIVKLEEMMMGKI